MHTNRLIDRLVEQCDPVRPVSRPWRRVVIWLALALPYVALVVLVISPRSDLATKASDMRFVVEQFAALITGISAATAAFASTIPGVDRRLLLIPVAPMAIWSGSLGQGCAQAWIEFGPGGLALQPDWFCLPGIALVGTIPAIVMAIMLRRGAPLTPHVTSALGGLAAAGLGNFGLRFFHTQDASLMVLVWQTGTVILLSALAGSAGRYLLNWRAVTGLTGQSFLANW